MGVSIHFMKVPAPALFPLLRSETQGRLLAALVLAERAETASELARHTVASLPTVMRELDRLAVAELIVSSPVGRRAVFRLNAAHPLSDAVRDIAMFAYGPASVIASELADVGGVNRAILFGSWAARRTGEPGGPPGDIDLLVIGAPDREALYDALRRAETRLRREVNATILTVERWDAVDDPFVSNVRERPWVELAIPGEANV